MIPTFSIIVPAFNVAPYLRECLDSVLAQTIADWECICVDDGSTDGSGAILDEYAARDMRFRVIHQANAGVGTARNRALDMVRGEWICFLDGDDVWHRRLLEVLVAGMGKHPDDSCFRVGFYRFGRAAEKADQKDMEFNFVKLRLSKTISMRDFYSYFFCHAYKRGLFEEVRFPRYVRGEDRYVLNRLQLQRMDAIVATDAKLYGYRQRTDSAMNSKPSLQILCDEMDHRLDIMEMIDASGKKVDYAGSDWLEKYFTKGLPLLTLGRPVDADAIRKEWRRRLPRLLKCRGLSGKGRGLMGLCSNRLSRPLGDFIVFALPYLYYKTPIRGLVAWLNIKKPGHWKFPE